MRRGIAIIVSLLLPATTLAAVPTAQYQCTSTNNCAVAKQVVLDAGSNNPLAGDESQFFSVKDAGATTSSFTSSATVQDGEELALRVYIDNDANPKKVSPSVARDVKVHIAVPQRATSSLNLYSSIMASNATPQKISDSLQLTGAQPFTLKEVAKSATLQWADANVSNGITTPVDDSVVAGGATIGKVAAGYRGSVIMTVLVKVHMASASKSGQQTSGTTGGKAAPTSSSVIKTSPHTSGRTGGTPAPTTAPAAHPAPARTPAPMTPAPATPATTTTSTSTSSAPAAPSTPATPPTPATQAPTTTTPTGRISNVTITPNPNSSSGTSTSDATAQPTSSQAPGQAATTVLPDTGATSATSGTAGLTFILVGLGIYYRSRQSLSRRLRRAA